MSNNDSINALLDLIRERQTFVITSHLRPDGDALGSSLGLMYLLEALGKTAIVNFTDAIPVLYRFLPGSDRIVCEFPETPPDAVIFLECDSTARSSLPGSGLDVWQSTFSINIDHHQTGQDFASFNWIDPNASSVGSMVYDLALAAGVPISRPMADCLYSAVLTDTGSFNYPSTSAATFAMAEHLVQSGTNPNLIARAIYFCNPLSKLQLLGVALSNLRIERNVSWSYISFRDLQRIGASVDDCEGVVNHLVSIVGIEAAVFVRELESETGCRLSIRSRGNYDVSQVALHFGGGGHFSAAGCKMSGSLHDVTARIVAQLHALCESPAPASLDASLAPEECRPLLA